MLTCVTTIESRKTHNGHNTAVNRRITQREGHVLRLTHHVLTPIRTEKKTLLSCVSDVLSSNYRIQTLPAYVQLINIATYRVNI